MKRQVTWAATVVLCCALLLNAASGAERLVNGFAAVVNDKVITHEDVEAAVSVVELEAARMRFGRQPQAYQLEVDRLRQAALLGLIERELILCEFTSAGYRLPESIIDQQIRQRIRDNYGDRTRMVRSLQARNSTVDAFKSDLRDQFIVMVMTDKNIYSGVLISPYKIQKFYEENRDRFQLKDRVKLRMISVWNQPDRDASATRKLVDDISRRLAQGESFTNLAGLYSDDPNRRQGGDRGWIERGSKDLRDDLQAAAFDLAPGAPSEVIEMPEGCYILLVEEHQPAHVKTLGEAREEIEAILRERERTRLRQEWIERLRAKSYVRLFPLG